MKNHKVLAMIALIAVPTLLVTGCQKEEQKQEVVIEQKAKDDNYKEYSTNLDYEDVLTKLENVTGLSSSEDVPKENIGSEYDLEQLEGAYGIARSGIVEEKYREIALIHISNTDQNVEAFNLIGKRKEKIKDKIANYNEKYLVAEQYEGTFVMIYSDNAQEIKAAVEQIITK